jgi:hypothetical protein
MKVGLFITNQQTLDTDMVSALDDQFAMVRLARDCGWNSLFSGQHYLNEGNNKQLQMVPLLARLAAEAGEMTIGLGILLLNLHNPVYTAERWRRSTSSSGATSSSASAWATATLSLTPSASRKANVSSGLKST